MHFFSQSQVVFCCASADHCSANDSRRNFQISGLLCLQLSPLWYSVLRTLLSALISSLSSLYPLKPWTLSGSFLSCAMTRILLQAINWGKERILCLFISQLSFSYCLMPNVLKTFVLCILSTVLMFGAGG